MSEINSAHALFHADMEETWDFVWKMHERILELESVTKELEAFSINGRILELHSRLLSLEGSAPKNDQNAGYWQRRTEAAEKALAATTDSRDGWQTAAEQRLQWLSSACIAAGPDCCATPGVCEPQYLTRAVETLRKRADANQAAADTLERLKKGAWVKIGDRDCQIMDVESVSAAYAERDALADKVAELTSERDRLTEQLIMERTLSKGKSDAISELRGTADDLERRLAEATAKKFPQKGWVGVKQEDYSELRRNAERLRRLLMDPWWRVMLVPMFKKIDAAIEEEAKE